MFATTFPYRRILYSLVSVLFLALHLPRTIAQTEPLRIIVIGAHPDDCDLCAGGTAIQWAKMGHQVKFLSLTNGDAGHQTMGGGALAKRRRAEAQEVARRMGIAEYEVLDNHDGELVPSLEVRLQVIRRIRRWKADVVILPRPNDYHPDHRNTGLVVQDAAYMVIVPNVASDTPPLKKNPVFLYCQDRFQKPNPFEPDIAVNIDPIIDKKVDALDAHESQFYEWLPWTMGILDQVPTDPVERKKWLAKVRQRPIKEEVRSALEKWYGEELAATVENAEAFEICEYGRQPDDGTIRQLFPMLRKPRIIRSKPVTKPLKIDGKLKEAAYSQAKKIYLKNSLTTETVSDKAYQSYVQVCHDQNNLYIAFTCFDRDIHSSFTKRDEYLWKEEAVEVFIDTDQEPDNYVEIEVSPKNVLYDSYIVDPVNIDIEETLKFNLNGIKTAVSVDGSVNQRNDEDVKWTVEIALPFRELKADFSADQLDNYQWKINFYRINQDQSPLKYLAWSPTQGSFHQPDKFGTIVFEKTLPKP